MMKNARTSLMQRVATRWAPMILSCLCSGASAAPWTTVGSAGTVDETDVGTVVLSGAGANISNAAPLPETAFIRYNVVAVDGLLESFGTLGGVAMTAVLRDNGNAARLRLRLREVDNASGTLSTRLTLDSNAFAASSSFEQRSTNSCNSGTPFNFDFERKAYFVEAEILRSASDGLPSLGTVAVHPIICVDIE